MEHLLRGRFFTRHGGGGGGGGASPMSGQRELGRELWARAWLGQSLRHERYQGQARGARRRGDALSRGHGGRSGRTWKPGGPRHSTETPASEQPKGT